MKRRYGGVCPALRPSRRARGRVAHSRDIERSAGLNRRVHSTVRQARRCGDEISIRLVTGKAVFSHTNRSSFRLLCIIRSTCVGIVRTMLVNLLGREIEAVLEQLADVFLEYELQFLGDRIELVLVVYEGLDRLDRNETVVSHRVGPFRVQDTRANDGCKVLHVHSTACLFVDMRERCHPFEENKQDFERVAIRPREHCNQQMEATDALLLVRKIYQYSGKTFQQEGKVLDAGTSTYVAQHKIACADGKSREDRASPARTSSTELLVGRDCHPTS